MYKTFITTIIALLAFAGNSIICRLALGDEAIDASSFTIIRLGSGILTLLIILYLIRVKKAENKVSKGSWLAATMLFAYAGAFSFAYITLDTGTGALILFASVQITIIMASLINGGRLHYSEWLGLVIAFYGFIYLLLPNLTTPSFSGFVAMMLAGVAWGIYTVKGRSSPSPLSDTTYNFLRTTPFILILTVFTYKYFALTPQGIMLAVLSGAITSGIGYAIWYIALGGLSSTVAAVVQLLVPVLATIGGVIFVGEKFTIRMAISSLLILGGIFMVMLGKFYFAKPSNKP